MITASSCRLLDDVCFLPHRLAIELDAVDVLEQAVQDGVGDGRSPRASCQWRRELAGDDGGASPARSSMTSRRSAAWSGARGLSRKSSRTSTSMRAQAP